MGAAPKNTKKAGKASMAKKKKLSGRFSQSLGRRIQGGSAESEAGTFNQVIPRRSNCQDICKHVYHTYKIPG